MREVVIERFLCSEVKKRGGECLKLYPPPKGIPDRLCVFGNGKVVFVELKRPEKGIVSKIQQYWHERLRSLGFKCCVCSTKECVNKLLEEL